MRVSLLTIFLANSVSAVAIRRASVPHLVHEKRDELATEDWQRLSRANPADVLPIRIALKQRNLDNAESYILDVSHPDSPNFGRHWTAEEIANTFRPSKETNDKVVSWLEASGIEIGRLSHSTGHNWIQFDATVSEVETLFDTKYHNFQHSSSGHKHVGCDSYSLPHDLAEHVEFILPTTQMGNPHSRSRRSLAYDLHDARRVIDLDAGAPPFNGLSDLGNCAQYATIGCLRALYNFPAGSTNHSGNQMGIPEWDQYLYRPDLQVYFEQLTEPVIPSDVFPEFIGIDGGKRIYGNSSQLSLYVLESAIDFQTSYAIIYPQNIRWYAVGDGVNVNSVGTFDILLDALDSSFCTYEGGDPPQDPHYPDPRPGGYKGKLQCGGAPKSNVISISYGQEEVNLSPAYEIRQCHEYMKLGLQGVSVIFASGDSGVAQRYNSGFKNKCLGVGKDSNKKSVNGTRFSPGFPQTCPYVTSVGATELSTESIHGGEKAVASRFPGEPYNDFFSGGGFSNVFKRPAYQAAAVEHYLTTYPPGYSKEQYNQTGTRAYPDVAALGLNIAIVYNGTVHNFGSGTSASAPIFASIVTLLNEARLGAGKKALGFLNPTLYAHPEAFNDVTVGGNPGCGTKGFACQPGWDPVTGLGTPNFEKLKAVFLALP